MCAEHRKGKKNHLNTKNHTQNNDAHNTQNSWGLRLTIHWWYLFQLQKIKSMAAHQINWKAAAVARLNLLLHLPNTEKVCAGHKNLLPITQTSSRALETTPSWKGFAAGWVRPYEGCATQDSSDPFIYLHFILSVTTYPTPPKCDKLSHFFPFAERDRFN